MYFVFHSYITYWQTYCALAGRPSADAVQAVCNGASMSAAQSTTVHGGLLHPHLRHCSSAASFCCPPAANSCSYFDTGVQCSVVGPFLWPALLPGTRYQTTYEIRCVLFIVFDGTRKLFFPRFTSVYTTH